MSRFGERILRREIQSLVKDYERMASVPLQLKANRETNKAIKLVKQRIKEIKGDIEMLSPEAFSEKHIDYKLKI